MPDIIENILKKYDCKVIVTGQGVFNIPKNDRIVNMINRTTLRELFAIIKGARLLIATDSGNVHFAGQLKTKTVALYSTAHLKTRAIGYASLISYQTPLFCAPCFKLAEHCAKDGECLSCIKPETVMSLIEEAIK